MADRDHPLDHVPDIAENPVDWDPQERRFRAPAGTVAAAQGGHDERRIRIAAPPEGGRSVPPPRRRPEVIAPSAPSADATTVSPSPGSDPPSVSPSRVVIPAPDRERAATPAARRTSPTTSKLEAKPPTGGKTAPKAERRRRLPGPAALKKVALVVLVLFVGAFTFGWYQFNKIETVDVSPVLASANGTNYLIVGSDTRSGVDPDAPNAGAILGDDSVGGPERSDTMLVLRVDGDGARMLSIPRDLWVTVSETGERSRINGAFNGGPQRLIATITDELGLPIHHYLEVDFVSFGQMVDAVGGITIDFPNPAFDDHSGLRVEDPGPATLDGTQALAFVRSRFYTEVIDGRHVVDGTGDLGRVERQQQFMAALMSKVTSTRNPVALAKIASSLSGGMRIDDDLSYFEALNLLRRMRGLDPAPNSLPTTDFTTAGGAQVLRLAPGADEVLAAFGSAGSSIE